MDIQEELQASADYLRERGVVDVDVAIVLGTGLGGLVNEIDEELAFNYSQIPHIPIATVEFHFGKLIYGILGGKRVLAWQGRFHYYEGYTIGVPFNTYQAPPVWVFRVKSWPSMADPDWKAATKGCSESSTVLMATSSPEFWLSMPMVIQLSTAIVGNTAMNAGLIPEATEAPKGSL